ncbi:hypothetical protein KSC_075930 [Ktedonobacter sp. SOSP1-52]|nr:hypothetical protein KSC_075930 [Ktedonobacter sp. SOSP1-52]
MAFGRAKAGPYRVYSVFPDEKSKLTWTLQCGGCVYNYNNERDIVIYEYNNLADDCSGAIARRN